MHAAELCSIQFQKIYKPKNKRQYKQEEPTKPAAMTSGRICIDIKDGIDESTALECVKQVVSMGRISKNNTMFCYASFLNTSKYGDVAVVARDYRKSDCFLVCKHTENRQNQKK